MDLHKIQSIARLIHKYLRNELSEEEKAALEQWLQESERNRQEFEYLCSTEFIEESQTLESDFDAEAAFERFRTARRKKRLFSHWSAWAALFLLLLGSGWWVQEYLRNSPSAIQPLAAGNFSARLTLEDGKFFELKGELQDTLRFSGTQIHLSGKQIEYRGQNPEHQTTYNTLEIPRKGEFKLVLSDGTRVWLNSESRLRYPVSFSSECRKVYLEGEAYFEVEPDARRPFQVAFGNAEIKVLGTSFNIQSYRDEPVSRTTLTSGRINITTAGQQLLLQPGEQAVISSDGREVEKRKVNVQPYVAWKDGRFVFRQQRLEDILHTVERWYDLKIKFTDDSLKNRTFSGNLERYENFDRIIRMLEMTGTISFKIEGNQITVSKK